jgi:hypothetical protein
MSDSKPLILTLQSKERNDFAYSDLTRGIDIYLRFLCYVDLMPSEDGQLTEI